MTTEYLTASRALDDVFDALEDPYRRRVLLALFERGSREGEVVRPPELASDDEDLTELRTVLYHCHLPKLDANGYIEWNPDTGRIRRGANFEELEPFLAVVLEHEDER